MVGGWRQSMDHSAGTGNIKYWCGTVCGNQKLAISTQPIWHSLVIALTRVALSLAWNTGTIRATGHGTSLDQKPRHGNRDGTRPGQELTGRKIAWAAKTALRSMLIESESTTPSFDQILQELFQEEFLPMEDAPTTDSIPPGVRINGGMTEGGLSSMLYALSQNVQPWILNQPHTVVFRSCRKRVLPANCKRV